MKETFNKFCKEIGFEIPQHLNGTILKEVIQEDSNEKDIFQRKLTFFIDFFSLPSSNELEEIFQKTKSFFNPCFVEFKIDIINKNLSKERVYELILFFFKEEYKKDLTILFKLEDIDFDINNNEFFINVYTRTKLELVNSNISTIKESLTFFGINNLKLSINNYIKNIINEEEENIIKEEKEILKQIKKTKNLLAQPSKEKNNNYIKNIKSKYFNVSLEEFYITEEINLLVEGKIFDIESITTKTELEIKTIYITDYVEAIQTKIFIRKDNNLDLSWLTNNKWVSIYGEKKIDITGNFYLQIKRINEISKDEDLVDNEDEKRVELSARTNMSAMDGFVSATDLLMHVKKINHKAVAIVDFQNIQSFPEIYNNAKKIGVKPIYGATFSTINSNHEIVFNAKDKLIKDETYVVFDLETTSLSPRYGEIIEFGAVKIFKGKVIDKDQFFIKPKKHISAFTTQLTGITQEMLDNESKYNNEKDAIEKIKEFFGNCTLVAHNAHFDMSFINEKIYQYNLEKIHNQVIDTLTLSKFLLESAHNYRLETVSKKYGISYDPTVAHRADYDADVLQKLWNVFINELERKKNIINFKQLLEVDEPFLNNKKFSYDLSVYVKNQKGLKELFQLITLSLTQNYFNGPRLFLDKIKKSDNLLFAPASINTKLIDLMFTGTTKEIDKEIDKWDFIGIPSPHLFSHLIARGNCTKEELHSMLKDLVLKAKQKNKIVVAIGDVRYLNERDSVGHSVYINTKGLEGVRHPLYRYNETKPKYPIQKFMTTKEMKEKFSFLNSSSLVDEIVVKNSNLISDMIDKDIEVIKSKLYPPEFDNSAIKLKDLVYENAHKIYGRNLPKIVSDRISRELDPIINYGFSVVYWLSHKLVAKSNEDGYLVGSRGSVGSSLVATLSGITEVNPLIPHYICSSCQYSEFVDDAKTTSGFDLPDKNCPNCQCELKKEGQTIPFETFLGFNADKVPDIDLNFSGDYQPIIHQEVKNMFGESHSFRAGTISTVASKTAFGFVKKWSEEKDMNKSNVFVQYLSTIIEGSKRTTGQHPGGIIIIPKEFDVEDFTPVNYPANDIASNWKTTHFDFHAIHDNVLKLDLLGHDDPTAIKLLQKLTKVKISDISFSDKKVLSLFSTTEALGIKPEDINNEPTGALGIPEFGTRFVRRMLIIAKPNSFNDLINLSGLSHGTDVWNGNAETLIKSGHTLNEVISCRDDIMVYLIRKGLEPSLSFSIMEKVRKGKGLSKEEEEILLKTGIEKWYIDSLNKIKYMFPKAHATAYVMMAWRIAWFKIYYPLEYYATYFTIRINSFDIDVALSSKIQVQKKLNELEEKQKIKHGPNKISAKEEDLIPTLEIMNEMMARNIKIANIDLYKSDAIEWKIDYDKQLLIPPFLVLDGLGDAAAKSIVSARNKTEFISIDDLIRRTQLNKTVIEKMKKLGILSNLNETDQTTLF